MQLTTAQKARLGMFVAGGLVLILGAVVVLTGMRTWEQVNLFTVRFHDSVNGLELRAPVKYQGLRVGRVQSMGICSEDPTAIEVVLALQQDIALHSGTLAVLDMSGLTGIKVINLVPGDRRGKLLPAGTLLPSGPSVFDKLADNVSVIVAEVRKVTQQISTWVTPENRQRIENLMSNLNRFVAHLDTLIVETDKPLGKLVNEVTQTTHYIGSTAQEATHILHESRNTLKNSEVAIIDTLGAIKKPLDKLDGNEIANMIVAIKNTTKTIGDRLSTQEAGRAIAAFAGTLDRVSRLIGDVDLVVRAGREDFTLSLNYLRQAAEDLREFSRILAQNPSALLRGREESQ